MLKILKEVFCTIFGHSRVCHFLAWPPEHDLDNRMYIDQNSMYHTCCWCNKYLYVNDNGDIIFSSKEFIN